MSWPCEFCKEITSDDGICSKCCKAIEEFEEEFGSDDPNKLKAMLLEDASTQQKEEFAKMLAQHCATADLQAKGHQCWTFVPSPTEYEKMAKYNKSPNYDNCPQCGKRVGLQFYHGNMGEGVSIVCTPWGKGCGFNEYISDDL